MPSTKVRRNDSETNRKTSDDLQLTDRVAYDEFSQDGIPEEIIFPEELNKFLREQIRDLTAENGCLRRSLEETEEKLKELRNKKNSPTELERASLAGGRASEIAASKIIELSKKLRDQTAEIEVLKTRCKSLESKLVDKKTDCDENDATDRASRDSWGDGVSERPFTLEEELKNRDEEIKLLKDKLSQTNLKLYESKNSCTLLRQDMNKAQKLLSSEVGDNVSIASISSHQSGWRGRAEQIQQLQQKIGELQSRLNEYEGSSKRGSEGAISITSAEKRQARSLRNLEKERRQKAEDSARELQETNAALETCKRKLEAARARIKVLENDLATGRHNVALLNEKRSHDEQLIEALNGQLKAVEDKYREREREIIVGKERAENECFKMCSELSKLRSANDRLQRTIEERETEVESLRNEKAVVKTAMEEKRPPASRIRNCANPSSASQGSAAQNEYVIISMAAEAERERLMELVAVLNRRLDEERRAKDILEENLRLERNKLARLETRLQRLEMERVGMNKINTGYKSRFSKSSQLNSSFNWDDEAAGDETRFKIELLEEECLALKARLATVQRDKASDLAAYKQMLDQARKTFQDAYRGKLNSCSYSTVTI